MDKKTVGFPNLGLEFTIDRVAFSVFGVDIYWYAIFIATGILLAYVYCTYEAKRQGLKSDLFVDILLVGIPSAVIGGRLYYVAFEWDYYSKHLNELFAIRDGGMAIYGAVIFAVIAVYLYLRSKKINVLKIFDICVIGLLIGQCLGRWGNFVNVEAYGYETEFFLKMAIPDANNGQIFVHPTFLYESLWNFAGIILLSVLIRRKKFDGQIFLLYIIWYGFGRMLVEGLRTDSLYFFGLRISQILGLVSAAAGVVIYIRMYIKNKKKEESENG